MLGAYGAAVKVTEVLERRFINKIFRKKYVQLTIDILGYFKSQGWNSIHSLVL